AAAGASRSGGGSHVVVGRGRVRRGPAPRACHAFAGPPDALDALHEGIAGALGLVGQAGEVLDVPVAEHDRHQDLVVVDLEVVDAGPGDRPRVRVEVLDPGTGHLEPAHLAL